MVRNTLRNIIIAVVVIMIVSSVMMKKRGNSKDNYSYYSYLTGGNGDPCIIKDGVMICRDKGVFPAWFYPSYYRRGRGYYNYPYRYGYGSYGYPYYGYGYGYGYRYPSYGYRRHGRHHGGGKWGKVH